METNSSIIFLYAVFILSIIILVISGVIVAAFVIPLQYQQAKVKNGLASLRKQMLIKGVLAEFVIVVALISLTARFIIADMEIIRYIITTMILMFSLGILGKAIIDYRIYRQQYTPKQKEFHERVAELEAAEEGKLTSKK